MKRTVTTSGQGTSRVVPDAAVVQVAARHRAAGVAEAVAGVDSAVSTIGAVAREHTEAARIASTDVSVWPAYDDQGRPAGFEARHGLRIGVADIPTAGRLLSALAEQVGDRLAVDGVSLAVSEPGPALALAREAAFADARARAEALAALSGSSLGEVLTVVEGAGGGGGRPEYAALAAKAAGGDLGLEPGEQSLAAVVTVTWRLA